MPTTSTISVSQAEVLGATFDSGNALQGIAQSVDAGNVTGMLSAAASVLGIISNSPGLSALGNLGSASGGVPFVVEG